MKWILPWRGSTSYSIQEGCYCCWTYYTQLFAMVVVALKGILNRFVSYWGASFSSLPSSLASIVAWRDENEWNLTKENLAHLSSKKSKTEGKVKFPRREEKVKLLSTKWRWTKTLYSSQICNSKFSLFSYALYTVKGGGGWKTGIVIRNHPGITFAWCHAIY